VRTSIIYLYSDINIIPKKIISVNLKIIKKAVISMDYKKLDRKLGGKIKK